MKMAYPVRRRLSIWPMLTLPAEEPMIMVGVSDMNDQSDVDRYCTLWPAFQPYGSEFARCHI